MYVVQMRIIMVVVEDAFQIGAIQHCHGARAAPAAVCSLTLGAHFHKTIPQALRHVSLSHHVIFWHSGTGLTHMGLFHLERRRFVCLRRRPPTTAASRALVYIFNPPNTKLSRPHLYSDFRATFQGAEGVIDKATDSITTRGCCSERQRARNTCGARLYTECGMRAAATSPELPASTALVEPSAIISRHLLPSGK